MVQVQQKLKRDQMGAGKILGGLAFLIIGIILLVIGFVPIPGLTEISFTGRMITLYDEANLVFSGDIMFILLSIVLDGYIYIALITPLVGYHYCRAGIKSMRYDKPKKQYFISETKIGLMIAGFVMVCVAAALILMIFLGYMDPSFSFLNPVNPTLPAEYAWVSMILPNFLIPVVLTILIIFFVYWIGSKIMKSGVKKEEMF